MDTSTIEQSPAVFGGRLADRMKAFLANQVHNTAKLDDTGRLTHRDLDLMVEHLVEDDTFYEIICRFFESVADRHLEEIEDRVREDLWHSLMEAQEHDRLARAKMKRIRKHQRDMRRIDQHEKGQRRSA